MAKSNACAIPSCKLQGHATCSWRMHHYEDGERVFTGKLCGLALCSVHAQTVAKKTLCLWHARKANELLNETRNA